MKELNLPLQNYIVPLYAPKRRVMVDAPQITTSVVLLV
jgi:hypothetical protein